MRRRAGGEEVEFLECKNVKTSVSLDWSLLVLSVGLLVFWLGGCLVFVVF